jgi:hypothetical protein
VIDHNVLVDFALPHNAVGVAYLLPDPRKAWAGTDVMQRLQHGETHYNHSH